MILIKPLCRMPMMMESPPPKSPAAARIKVECIDDQDEFRDSESPLDLRVKCGRMSPGGGRDSGTESDDTDDKIEIQDGGPDCKPYKKSLIKRCKFFGGCAALKCDVQHRLIILENEFIFI